MKKFPFKFYHSFPVQLLLLHLRKYQVLLIFWLLLFSTVNGQFAKMFGAGSLLLAPEYLGQVSFYSMFIFGISLGTFIMSWNITTFILHSKRFKFLATTTQPFSKYCLNNAIIPLAFFIFYLLKLIQYQGHNELNSASFILLLVAGFLCGLLLVIFISFFYFFNADKTILRALQKKMGGPRKLLAQIMTKEAQEDENAIPVLNYFNSFFTIRRARNVDHYNKHFLDSIFKRHHFAAVLTICFAFLCVILLSYLISFPSFRIPAGASVLLFFTVLIGITGAFAYMFRGWSILLACILLLLLNRLIKNNILDTRSKAYGLNYQHPAQRPEYSFQNFNKIFTDDRAQKDADSTLQILQKWKSRQSPAAKPKLVIINVSGGGIRSAAWTMSVLQRADSLLHGQLMKSTVLITGSSGGMLGATYFREIYREKISGLHLNLYSAKYVNNISKDLLNAVFAYYAVNDFFTPYQFFYAGKNKYAKDRGYAFEQQLNINTGFALNKTLRDYEAPEKNALIPMIIFSSTVTADGRAMLISPQPISYLTAPGYKDTTKKIRNIDAIDFCEFFKAQDAKQLRITTALRMSATFPYILPNVYLPSDPIVDVMDGGLRDTFGKEISLRFLHAFKDWINENTSGIVYLQIRDTKKNEINSIVREKTLWNIFFEPLFTLQRNWSSFQDYYQNDMLSYARHFFQVPFRQIIFQYVPREENKAAALSWHLTSREKTDIRAALYNPLNKNAFQSLEKVMEEKK